MMKKKLNKNLRRATGATNGNLRNNIASDKLYEK